MTVYQTFIDENRKVLEKNYQSGVNWEGRHVRAFELSPVLVDMGKILASYADDYKNRYGSPVGDDGFLGEEWLKMWRGLRGLLNGDLGNLDGGTLDAALFAMARAAGFDDKELE